MFDLNTASGGVLQNSAADINNGGYIVSQIRRGGGVEAAVAMGATFLYSLGVLPGGTYTIPSGISDDLAVTGLRGFERTRARILLEDGPHHQSRYDRGVSQFASIRPQRF